MIKRSYCTVIRQKGGCHDAFAYTWYTERKREIEILALYSIGIKLSKFQQDSQQPNSKYKIRKSKSDMRYFGVYS